MQFVADLYEYQASEGRYFLHEHPWAATSWHLQCMQKVLGMPGVVEIRVDQCAYGQMSRDERGVGLALKPTRFATNAPLLARILEKRCSNHMGQLPLHRHVHLMCGRASAAAIYPPAMCEAIVEGILNQKTADKTGKTPVAEVSLCNLSRADYERMREDTERTHEETGANR